MNDFIGQEFKHRVPRPRVPWWVHVAAAALTLVSLGAYALVLYLLGD